MKDVKHGSKVKGNTKNELTHLMRSAMLFIKVNITVTLHTSLIQSLALVSGNIDVPLDPAGRLAISCSFCCLSIKGPANLCYIVATECLSAAECSALRQPSPPSPFAHCLPADPYKTGFPPHLPLDLQAKSSVRLLLRQSLCSTTSTSTLCLSPALITLARDRGT